jgi:hypothetical protein
MVPTAKRARSMSLRRAPREPASAYFVFPAAAVAWEELEADFEAAQRAAVRVATAAGRAPACEAALAAQGAARFVVVFCDGGACVLPRMLCSAALLAALDADAPDARALLAAVRAAHPDFWVDDLASVRGVLVERVYVLPGV